MKLSFAIIEDRKTIRGLLNKIFGDYKVPLGTVEWLSKNPSGRNIWYTAFYKAQPIGLYGMLPVRVRIGDESSLSFLCNNVGVLPEFRGKGVFTDLGKYTTECLKSHVLFGVPNKAATKGHEKVGWKTVGTLELLYGRSDKKNIVNSTWTVQEVSRFRTDLHRMPAFIGFERAPRNAWWRYTKPGEKYNQTHLGNLHVTWKEFEGFYQVMECDPFIAPHLLLPDDQDFSVLCLRDSMQSEIYKQMGFKTKFERDLIIKNYDGNSSPDMIRFELTDLDNF